MNPIIIILGPTSTGKSDLAIKLAKIYSGEIISADSRQIYTEFSIGSGKIHEKDMGNIPHHMINIKHIWEDFNVAQFKVIADTLIHNLHEHHILPFLVGGTGLYIDAVINNYLIPPYAPNESLRKTLSQYSLSQLQSTLKNSYPEKTFNNSDWHNPVRLIRAIEILSTSPQEKAPPIENPYTPLYIGLTSSLEYIKYRITNRVDNRLQNGAIQEMITIRNILTQKTSATQAEEIIQQLGLGSIAITQFIDKKISYDMMRTQYIQAEYQYARRQLTWFRKNKSIIWFDVENTNLINQVTDCINTFLKKS